MPEVVWTEKTNEVRWYRGGYESNTYKTRPLLMKANVSGITLFPSLSVTGLTVAAHNRDAMLMNRPFVATWRPTQILDDTVITNR